MSKTSPYHRPVGPAWALGLFVVVGASASSIFGAGGQSVNVGDGLARIVCPDRFEARVAATKLSAPDGLVIDHKGRLLVVEEKSGRVTRIGNGGKHKKVAKGLKSPEGIALGEGGRLYVVEDRKDGRLIEIDKDGDKHTLVKDLDAPEGVLFFEGNLYVTESTAQLVKNKLTARTRVSVLRPTDDGWGDPTVIVESPIPFVFSELCPGAEGELILVNEAGSALVRRGLMRLDLEDGSLETFTEDLVTPEGICTSPNQPDGFPLFVAEEDIDGKGSGRISTIDATGKRTTFATGFATVEDVAVAADGSVFVSEDETGLIIELRPIRTDPD